MAARAPRIITRDDGHPRTSSQEDPMRCWDESLKPRRFNDRANYLNSLGGGGGRGRPSVWTLAAKAIMTLLP